MRRREKADYTAHMVDRNLYVILDEGVTFSKLPQKQISALKKLSRLAFRLVKIRSAKNEIAQQEAKTKESIDAILDELAPFGVIGHVRQAGPETSTELKRVEVYGREVNDPMMMLEFLGDYSGQVIKSVQLPFNLMAQDPAKFDKALSYLSGLYGEDLQNNLVLEIHNSRFDSLLKDGSLPKEPEGLWKYKAKSARIDAKIL